MIMTSGSATSGSPEPPADLPDYFDDSEDGSEESI